MAEAELREAHAQGAELRSKARPVEDYLAADKGAALAAARDTVAAAQRRLQAAENAARVRASMYCTPEAGMPATCWKKAPHSTPSWRDKSCTRGATNPAQ